MIDLLAHQMSDAYEMLRGRLHVALTDAEYFWEPVPDCWTVYQEADGRWTYHYEIPAPEPHPFTTIAWRVTHLALCKLMYHEYAFGPGKMTWQTVETPPSASEGIAALEAGQQLLIDDLASLSEDGDLDAPRLTNWGEEWPTWRIFWTLIHHDAHHGGEIGSLRDLYLRAKSESDGHRQRDNSRQHPTASSLRSERGG